MGGGYRCCNAAADIESSDYLHPAGFAGHYEIIQYLICNRLVKGPLVPERPEIEFQRFQLNAEFAGDIVDGNIRKIGLPCHRT